MKEIIYLDTCYSAYFQGFSGETLISFHHKGQTVKECLDNLLMNANNEYHDVEVYTALHKYINDKLQELDPNELVINEESLDDNYEEQEESMIHYFGIKESEE